MRSPNPRLDPNAEGLLADGGREQRAVGLGRPELCASLPECLDFMEAPKETSGDEITIKNNLNNIKINQ